MQLYGYIDSQLIFIDDAKKGVSHICPACGEEIRVRGGRFLTRHFFHVKNRRRCTFRQRSMRHLAIQKEIARLIPGTLLEHNFPDLHRIADVYWPQKKIAFEVQSTPITVMEIAKRERDYHAAGIEIVWILSDHLFNKHNVTPAEEVLRQKSAYYTDIGFNKSGIFYDQFEVIHQNRRVFRLPTLEINLLKPKKMPTAHKIELPKIALERENNSKIYFYGDIFDRSIQFKRFRESLIKFEKKHRRARFDIYTDYSKGEAQDLYLYYKNKLKLFVQHTGEATESREKLQWKE